MMLTFRSIFLIAACLVFAGCGDNATSDSEQQRDSSSTTDTSQASGDSSSTSGTSDTSGTSNPTDVSGDGLDPIPSGLGTLVIPVSPVSEGPIYMGLVSVEDAGGRKTLKGESSVVLAFGDEYPKAYTAPLFAGYDIRCSVLEGTFEITGIDAHDTASVSSAVQDNAVSLEVSAEGETVLRVRGTYTPPTEGNEATCLTERYGAAQGYDFEWSVTVYVWEPVDVKFTVPFTCNKEATFYAVAGTQLNLNLVSYVVSLVNAAGDTFSPHNADPTRPITITVTGPEGSTLALKPPSGGFESLVFPAEVGALSVSAAVGEPLQYTVIEPGEVTDAEIVFVLPGYGGGGISPLVSGETYEGFARTGNRVVPTIGLLKRDGVAVCTRSNPAWFELTGLTPDTCPLDVPGSIEQLGFEIYSETVGQSAHVIADGVCSVALSAPILDGGQGIFWDLSVTLIRTESMNGP